MTTTTVNLFKFVSRSRAISTTLGLPSHGFRVHDGFRVERERRQYVYKKPNSYIIFIYSFISPSLPILYNNNNKNNITRSRVEYFATIHGEQVDCYPRREFIGFSMLRPPPPSVVENVGKVDDANSTIKKRNFDRQKYKINKIISSYPSPLRRHSEFIIFFFCRFLLLFSVSV